MQKQSRDRKWKIGLLVCVVLIMLFIAGAFWLASFIMTGQRQTLDAAMQWQSAHYDTFSTGLTAFAQKGRKDITWKTKRAYSRESIGTAILGRIR